MQNSPFSSLAVAVTIASTHCAYPRRDGQAELAWKEERWREGEAKYVVAAATAAAVV